MFEYRRANNTERKLFKYDKSIKRRTALIAENNDDIVGIMEYDIHDFSNAKITNYKCILKSENAKIFEGFIEELLYWNPYIKKLEFTYSINNIDKELIKNLKYKVINNNSLDIDQNIDIIKINIKDIIPEQLSIDKEKLKIVESWIKKPEDVIINCIDIDGKIVCIDGYSRLIASFKKGFEYVYCFIEKTEDIKFYKECLSWCKKENVRTIADLSKRVVSPSEHQTIWIDRCQAYLS